MQSFCGRWASFEDPGNAVLISRRPSSLRSGQATPMDQATTANKRRAARQPVQFRAMLSWDKGRTYLACSIRDISKTGARIRLLKPVGLPAIVHLIDIPNKMAYEAAVVWRRAPFYGLAFTLSYTLTSTETPLFLRKLWYESAR